MVQQKKKKKKRSIANTTKRVADIIKDEKRRERGVANTTIRPRRMLRKIASTKATTRRDEGNGRSIEESASAGNGGGTTGSIAGGVKAILLRASYRAVGTR